MEKILFAILPFIFLNLGQGGCNSQSDTRPVATEISQPPSPPAISKDSILQKQEIEDINVLHADREKIEIEIQGLYINGCSKFHSYRTFQRSDTLFLEVFSAQPREAMCTEALVPFTKKLEIKHPVKAPGKYLLSSAGIHRNFQIE